MAIYALGILPFLSRTKSETKSQQHALQQVAFADDLTGSGKLLSLRHWWDQIVEHGPTIGYYANASKTWLIVRESIEQEAIRIFKNTSIKIITEGRRHLIACVGNNAYKASYVMKKVNT